MTTHPVATIDLSNLVASKLNVRKHSPKSVDSLAASIAHIGLLLPLVVRPTDDGHHEVVAGGRRLRALKQNNPDAPVCTVPVNCVVIAAGDDALAIEASLVENIERAEMDEFDQYNALAALIKSGTSEQEAADALGLPLTTVHKRLALSRLMPGIQALHRSGAINTEAVKLLTIAPKARQTEYLKLHKTNAQPQTWQLRAWLLGGHAINTDVALFPLEQYTGAITTDLFADERLFADADQFWILQNQAIAERRDALAAAGWQTVTVLDPSTRFNEWDFQPATKAASGHAILQVEADGAVTTHKGLMPKRLAAATRRVAAANGADPTTSNAPEDRALERPEFTETLATISIPSASWPSAPIFSRNRRSR